jgi:DNA-binding CsgD family transcriptional regulator
MDVVCMDYGRITLEELKNGYTFDADTDSFVCSACGQRFENGQVYPIGGNFFTAEPAAKRHILDTHGGSAALLVNADTKYNTLTQTQKDLLLRFAAGSGDREIAKALGVSESTVRRQRFNFREKAKQAKLYLATYEQAFQGARDELIPVPNRAEYVDDRYVITEQERERILKGSFSSLSPLRLKAFPPKEKKKVVILSEIVKQFQSGEHYSEREVNDILRPVYEDYVTIRRYLISYGLMDRTRSGSEYWLTE